MSCHAFFLSTSIDCIYDVYVHWLENDQNIEHTTAKEKGKKQSKGGYQPRFQTFISRIVL